MIEGTVALTTYPKGATVYLDNKLVVDDDTKQLLKTPVWLTMEKGMHNIRLTLDGYFDVMINTYVYPNETQYINRDFSMM